MSELFKKVKICTVNDVNILFVMALDTEYGPHLKERFSPLFLGVGPIEAAVKMSQALQFMSQNSAVPDLVVSLGSAGSASLNVTQVYQATSVSYRDMDASPLGFDKGVTPFLEQPNPIQLPYTLPNLETARLSTGANIVSGDAYHDVPAEMVDMESYAVLRACQQFNIPLIALRGISDGKHDLHSFESWTQYLDIVDQTLAQACDILFDTLHKTQLSL